MISTLKLSNKLTTKSIKVFLNPYNFKFYYCKITLINDPNKQKEIYIPKNGIIHELYPKLIKLKKN